MKINFIGIGKGLSDWVNKGFQTYADRLPRNSTLNLIKIPALRWTKNADLAKIMLQESQILLEAIPKEGEVIVLDRTGEEINTLILLQKMADWRDKGSSNKFVSWRSRRIRTPLFGKSQLGLVPYSSNSASSVSSYCYCRANS